MKLISFRTAAGIVHVGALVGERVADVTELSGGALDSLATLLEADDHMQVSIKRLLTAENAELALADLELCAPVVRPGKYLALGLNYKKHAEEAARKGVRVPKHQVWFNKQTTCVNGPYAPVHLPRVSDKLDYEAELAFVIGRRCRHVAAADAAAVIGGYTIANDFSVRDWQMRSQTWTMGKSFDTHGPLGPWLTTPDELAHPERLDIRAYVNGELRQSANTSDMIYSFGEMVEHLSAAFTLEPGDVIATGTPAGIGSAMEPPQYLQVGDIVRVEIEGIGHIENEIVAEPIGGT